MADAISTTRRAVIKAFPFIGAAVAAPVLLTTVKPRADEDFVAIPREAYDAIKTWADAHRASVKATADYGDYVRPIGLRRQAGGPACTADEKAVADRLFADHVAIGEAVGPAREKMIFALLRATA